jgi:hypothetical protein
LVRALAQAALPLSVQRSSSSEFFPAIGISISRQDEIAAPIMKRGDAP